MKSPGDVANLLMSDMAYFEQEHLRVLLLNMKNYVLNNWRESLYVGTLNSSVLRVAEIFRQAIRANAAAIIVAHNHPSGDPTPSPEDIRVTRDIRQAGTLLDIELLDHVVIGKQRFVSISRKSPPAPKAAKNIAHITLLCCNKSKKDIRLCSPRWLRNRPLNVR